MFCHTANGLEIISGFLKQQDTLISSLVCKFEEEKEILTGGYLESTRRRGF